MLNLKQGEIPPYKRISVTQAVWALYLLVRKDSSPKAILTQLKGAKDRL